MNEYANEHEQWEAIRDWWRKNGVQLLVIFVLSLSVGFGWRYWQTHQLEKKEEASQLFDQLLSVQASANPDATLISRITTALENDYSQTVYASLAALFEAKNAVANKDLPLAEQKLRWAMDHADIAAIQAMTKVRLARVLLAEKKLDEALAVLEKNTSAHYLAAIEQVKGDIYLAQGDTAKARVAYQSALTMMPVSSQMKDYVQMQLNQLPG